MVVILANLPACDSDDPPEGDAPDAGVLVDASSPDANAVCANSTLTYANFAEPFFASYCLMCHSETVTNRRGAPAEVNFDRFDLVNEQKFRIKVRAGTGTSMPPAFGATPSADERASLVEWLDCGPVN
jgi:uncharacterized membrane protein